MAPSRRPPPEDARASFLPYAGWGGAALVAVSAVALFSSYGGDRTPPVAPPAAPAPIVMRTDPTLLAETQRLAATVKSLSADRDRLAARLEQMERTVGDMTASVPRERPPVAPPPVPTVAAAPAKPAVEPAAPPSPAADVASKPAAEPAGTPLPPPRTKLVAISPAAGPPPETVVSAAPRETDTAARAPAPKVIPASEPPVDADKSTAAEPPVAKTNPADLSKPIKPAPRQGLAPLPPREGQAAESVGTQTEFAVDLGGDSSVDGLRARWTTLRSANSRLLDAFKPLVSVRDGPQPGTVELRLIAGPLPNASAAARLCAALATAGVAGCRPTSFDGQRLALR